MYILSPHPKLTESETKGVEPSQTVVAISPDDLMQLTFENTDLK